MSKKFEKKLIVALDVGTSKVAAIVGEVDGDGTVEILGVGTHPSRGLRKGVVVNIESTVQSIQRAVEEAELRSGCQIHSVYTGITGSHIRSFNSNGVVPIREKEVTALDVDRVIDAARAVAIPADQKVIQILPQGFIIDKQEGIRDPVGMSGVRLEARVHIITGAESAAENIIKCVQRCNLDVDDIILDQVASSYAVLSEDEKDLGVCLVDIGGGTTDIAIFKDGFIHHTAVIPIAGDQVTNDIAVHQRTPTQNAEEIKVRYACALTGLTNPEDSIEVPSVGDRPLRRLLRQSLTEVVHWRMDELLRLVQSELQHSAFEDLIPTGLVLTGGTARMQGIVELAENIFNMPVRLGIPHQAIGNEEIVGNPAYAAGIGLLMFGAAARNAVTPETNGNIGMLQRMKGWFQGNF